jgi:hypothetical protein
VVDCGEVVERMASSEFLVMRSVPSWMAVMAAWRMSDGGQ